jgi:phage tail sheath gpL-like
MSVAFNNMPGDIRVPGAYFEINAGIPPYSGTSRTLLIGRKLAGGSAQLGIPINLGAGDPNALFGAGSMLAEMAIIARWHNPNGEIWALPVTDPSGVAATGTIAITGTATAAGTLVRYIAGERYSVGVAVGDTAAVVAAALKAAIDKGYTKYNRAQLAPVTTSVATGTVTLTARHVGVEGNTIRVEAGLDGNEVDPAGLTVTIASATLTSGTGDVDLATALAALGDQPFDHIGGPYSSTAQLNAVRQFLSDSGSGRWSPTVGLYGHYFTTSSGNLSAQTTLGAGRNDPHVSILGLNNYPQAPWAWVAALTAVVGFSKNLGRSITEAVEIARPLQTLVLQGLRGPKNVSDQWKMADRDSLYRNGISAVVFRADGQAALDRVVTTYQTNAWGQADITLLDVETLYIAAYAARYFKQRILATYPRSVLKDDNPRSLQGVTTPAQIRATLIHAYREMYDGGLAEKPELFAEYVIVERSADPNRVNAYIPFDVANQLRVFAANVTIFPELNDQIAALQ